MSLYKGPEIVPDSTRPFIGVRPGVARGIYRLIDEVRSWHDQNLPFKAIAGELEEAPGIFIMSPLPDPRFQRHAMIPHSHQWGILLMSDEKREEPTIVCETSRERISHLGGPDFQQIRSLQEDTVGQERTFAQAWTGARGAFQTDTIKVPFLYIFPGTDHFRKVETLDQYHTFSVVRGLGFDGMGNRNS